MYNKVTLIGNLGNDPEIKALKTGEKVANFSLATSESWKDKNTGERKTQSEWHKIVIFGKVAEIAEKYLSKGSKVLIEGKIKTRKWTDQSGAEKYTTEIVLSGVDSKLVMLDSKQSGNAKETAYKSQEPLDDMADDEIPFN